MMLSEDQIQIIRHHIDQSRISIETLRDDILDHLCCVIEYKIKHGKTFHDSLQEAIHELAPDGLNEIQRETVFLLNSTKIIFMKKLMYTIGLFSSMTFCMGSLFKILHWPGADELFTYGFLGFVLLFLPMLAVNHFKVNINKAMSEKLRVWLGIFSAMLIGLGFVFKILHISGADFLLLGGFLPFILGFLPLLFFTMYKRSVS